MSNPLKLLFFSKPFVKKHTYDKNLQIRSSYISLNTIILSCLHYLVTKPQTNHKAKVVL